MTTGSRPTDPRVARWLVLAAVVLLGACLAWRTESSRDLGFHVATGRWILAHHAWPRVDTFTYTLAGRPYVDMHGLFQLALALAYRGGMAGVALLRLAFVLATVAVLWVHARRRGVGSPVLLGLGFGLALVTWDVRMLTRPELASVLLLAALLLLLRQHAQARRARWLAAAVALQLVWVWSHALSLFGIAVFGLYAAASLAGGLRRRAVDAAPWLALAAAVAVMFLNPYGARGVAFLWELRTRLEAGNAFGDTIAELMSPFSPDAAAVPALRAFRAMLVVTAVLVAVRARRLALFDLGVVALFGALAAARMRVVGLFAVAALPVLLEAASGLGTALAAKRRAGVGRAGGVAAALVVLALVFAAWQVVTGAYDAWNRYPFRFGYAESPAALPTGTVAYLERHGLHGRMFNTLGFGGYLLMHRDDPVFIDGRLEVVGEAFYREYAAAATPEGWSALVARWQPELALVSSTDHAMIARLHADSTWAPLEADGAAVLFARRTPGQRAVIDAATAALARLDAPAPAAAEAIAPLHARPWLAAWFVPRRDAFASTGRGKAFALLGMLHAARREYARALRESDPPDPGLVRSYAALCAALGRGDEALTWCRWLVAASPGDERARALLAQLEGR